MRERDGVWFGSVRFGWVEVEVDVDVAVDVRTDRLMDWGGRLYPGAERTRRLILTYGRRSLMITYYREGRVAGTYLPTYLPTYIRSTHPHTYTISGESKPYFISRTSRTAADGVRHNEIMR